MDTMQSKAIANHPKQIQLLKLQMELALMEQYVEMQVQLHDHNQLHPTTTEKVAVEQGLKIKVEEAHLTPMESCVIPEHGISAVDYKQDYIQIEHEDIRAPEYSLEIDDEPPSRDILGDFQEWNGETLQSPSDYFGHGMQQLSSPEKVFQVASSIVRTVPVPFEEFKSTVFDQEDVNLNFTNLLLETFQNHHQMVALAHYETHERIQFDSLQNMVMEICQGLANVGFQTGHVCIVVFDNDHTRSIAVLLAIIRLSGVAIPLYAKHSEELVQCLVGDERIRSVDHVWVSARLDNVNQVTNSTHINCNPSDCQGYTVPCSTQEIYFASMKKANIDNSESFPENAILVLPRRTLIQDGVFTAMAYSNAELVEGHLRTLRLIAYKNSRDIVCGLRMDTIDGLTIGLFPALATGKLFHMLDDKLDIDGDIADTLKQLRGKKFASTFLVSSIAMFRMWQFIEQHRPLVSTSPPVGELVEIMYTGLPLPCFPRSMRTYFSWNSRMSIRRLYSTDQVAGLLYASLDQMHPLDASMLKSIGKTNKASRACVRSLKTKKKITDPEKAGELVLTLSIPNTGNVSVYTGDMAFIDSDKNIHIIGLKNKLITLKDGGHIPALKFEEMLTSYPIVEDAALIQTNEKLELFADISESVRHNLGYAIKSIKGFVSKNFKLKSGPIPISKITCVNSIPRHTNGHCNLDQLLQQEILY